MKERAVVLAGSLVGVLSEPELSDAKEESSERPGILLLNSGLLHRVGPNRVYVKLARRLAQRGFPVLRFDFSGIGDSPASTDQVPFEQTFLAESRAAMDHLERTRGLERFVLIGLCLGADVAFSTAWEDERVVGAALLNGSRFRKLSQGSETPEPMEEMLKSADARSRLRYYQSQLANPRRWLRLLSGKSDIKAVLSTLSALVAKRFRRTASAPREPLDVRELVARGVRFLVLYTTGSTAWDLFQENYEEEIRSVAGSGKLRLELMERSDHVLTLLHTQTKMMDAVEGWLDESFGGVPESPGN